MEPKCETIAEAIDLGNLGVIAPHKVKYGAISSDELQFGR